MSKYDEMVDVAAEKFGHCRVAGGLDDHDVARQMLEAIGITRESVETPMVQPPIVASTNVMSAAEYGAASNRAMPYPAAPPPEIVATGKLETMTAVSQQDGKIGAIEPPQDILPQE
jgi:hypothetical protein